MAEKSVKPDPHHGADSLGAYGLEKVFQHAVEPAHMPGSAKAQSRGHTTLSC